MMIITSLVIGIFNFIFSKKAILGASGIVYMLITLSSAANISDKSTKKSTKEVVNNIELLEQEMREAAKNLDFERAMELRDIIFEIKSQN